MGFFVMMFLFFFFMRMSHWRRHHFARLHYYGPRRYHYHYMQARHLPVVEAPRPNAYEQLKQRYVRGDIDVDEYERALDEILRSPEGQRIVN